MTSRHFLSSAAAKVSTGCSSSRNTCLVKILRSSWPCPPSSSSSCPFSTSSNGFDREGKGGDEVIEKSSTKVEGADTANTDAPAKSKNTGKLGRKFMKPKEKRYIVQSQRARNSDLDVRAEASGLPWREVVSWYVA